MPKGTYADPVWIRNKRFGFWWFIGFILMWTIRIIFWIIVLVPLFIIWVASVFVGRRHDGKADASRQGANVSDRR
jgi:uncharacterized membrane protein